MKKIKLMFNDLMEFAFLPYYGVKDSNNVTTFGKVMIVGLSSPFSVLMLLMGLATLPIMFFMVKEWD